MFHYAFFVVLVAKERERRQQSYFQRYLSELQMPAHEKGWSAQKLWNNLQKAQEREENQLLDSMYHSLPLSALELTGLQDRSASGDDWLDLLNSAPPNSGLHKFLQASYLATQNNEPVA